MSRLAAVGLCCVLSSAVFADSAPEGAPLDAVKAYLEARAATMQEKATPADVERVVALCTPSVAYEHPRVGVSVTGVEALRSGMLRFLGTSRNATITLTNSLQGRDMVAVQTDVSFEAKDGDAWKPVKRSQTWVFELDGAKLKRIIEYW